MLVDDAVNVLNGLIQTSEDGRKGFADAGRKATKAELKTMFRRRSADCETAVIELQQLVQSLGGTPKGNGTLAATAQRGWTANSKPAIGDINLALLEDVERAEDKAKAAYVQALTLKLSQQVRNVVKRQHDGAVHNHDLVRYLRNSYQPAETAVAIGSGRRPQRRVALSV
jgi:uncharacterized protein (TIGR02284 family)